MSGTVISPGWPICETCGGRIWTLSREPHRGGLERQSLTCAVCAHVTERTVIVTDDDLKRLAAPA